MRDLKLQRMGACEGKPRCVVARGARNLWNRTFEWRVGARVVSDGVEAYTSV